MIFLSIVVADNTHLLVREVSLYIQLTYCLTGSDPTRLGICCGFDTSKAAENKQVNMR